MSAEATLGSSLEQLTVLEIGDQRGEYGAMLLAGLGANIIKIEPREGSPSRAIGPFASDARDREHSLFFWRYNLNKKSVTLDIEHPAAKVVLARLARTADIVLLSGEFETVERWLELWQRLALENPRLIVCTITPFGLTGPYRSYRSTDLTQMALGGIMAVCGYDPNADGAYDTPPIAPAMWHSYHLAGEYAAVAILAALNFRDLTGEGQFIDTSTHEAVNTCTELAIPIYVYNGQVVKRQTARHAMVAITPLRVSKSSDDVTMLAAVPIFTRELRGFTKLTEELGIAHVLGTPEFAKLEKENPAAADTYRNELLYQIVTQRPAREVFERAQGQGLPWAPMRRPEENLDDPHFNARGTFANIAHQDLGRDLRYPGTVASDGHAPHMSYTRRAPRLGEHTHPVLEQAGYTAEEIAVLEGQKVI